MTASADNKIKLNKRLVERYYAESMLRYVGDNESEALFFYPPKLWGIMLVTIITANFLHLLLYFIARDILLFFKPLVDITLVFFPGTRDVITFLEQHKQWEKITDVYAMFGVNHLLFITFLIVFTVAFLWQIFWAYKNLNYISFVPTSYASDMYEARLFAKKILIRVGVTSVILFFVILDNVATGHAEIETSLSEFGFHLLGNIVLWAVLVCGIFYPIQYYLVLKWIKYRLQICPRNAANP
jgi:hypothetical protein